MHTAARLCACKWIDTKRVCASAPARCMCAPHCAHSLRFASMCARSSSLSSGCVPRAFAKCRVCSPTSAFRCHIYLQLTYEMVLHNFQFVSRRRKEAQPARCPHAAPPGRHAGRASGHALRLGGRGRGWNTGGEGGREEAASRGGAR